MKKGGRRQDPNPDLDLGHATIGEKGAGGGGEHRGRKRWVSAKEGAGEEEVVVGGQAGRREPSGQGGRW